MLTKTFNHETISGWCNDGSSHTDEVEYKIMEINSQGFIKLGDYFYDASDLQFLSQQIIKFKKQIDAGK